MIAKSCRGLLAAILFVSIAGQAQTQPPSAKNLGKELDVTSTAPQPTLLTPQLLHQLLVAEWQIASGQAGPGYQLLLDAGRKTLDERLFARAVEVAMGAGAGESAIQAIRSWKQVLPRSSEAAQQHFRTLLAMGRWADAVEPFRSWLELSLPDQRTSVVQALPPLLSGHAEKARALAFVKEALAQELQEMASATAAPPELRASAWAVVASQEAHLQLSLGSAPAERRWEATLSALDRGWTADPGSEAIADVSTRLVDQSPLFDTGLDRYLGRTGHSAQVAMNYARALVQAGRYAKAKAILLQTTGRDSNFAAAWLLLSALHSQSQEWTQAEAAAHRFLELEGSAAQQTGGSTLRQASQAGLRQAHLTLAQAAEQRKDFDTALAWLDRLPGELDSPAVVLRRASVLASRGDLTGARQLIRSQPASDDDTKKRLLLAEANLLREQRKHAEAYGLLTEAAERFGADPDLQYDQAMVAEKMGNLELMEIHLRAVMQARPTEASAYNALGYAWADKKIRLSEARSLIEKALELSPGDPYITDSLGWVAFRTGNLAEAIKHLQAAFAAKPDAEIGAHLGEVFWANGQRNQARATWERARQLNPLNETLIETLKRLGVQLP